MQSLFNIFFPDTYKILVVCTANVCRSPMAHAVLRDMIKKKGLSHKIKVESAGTHVPTSGLRPDSRTINVLKEQGINCRRLGTRQLLAKDAGNFDKILVMDKSNMAAAIKILGEDCSKAQYLLDYLPNTVTIEVADPYYGPQSGFPSLYKVLVDACAGVVDEVEKKVL